jgi:hypothetical protein
MCGYLEEYIDATAKMHKSQAKDYEKVLKVFSSFCCVCDTSLTITRPSTILSERVIISTKAWKVSQDCSR